MCLCVKNHDLKIIRPIIKIHVNVANRSFCRNVREWQSWSIICYLAVERKLIKFHEFEEHAAQLSRFSDGCPSTGVVLDGHAQLTFRIANAVCQVQLGIPILRPVNVFRLLSANHITSYNRDEMLSDIHVQAINYKHSRCLLDIIY